MLLAQLLSAEVPLKGVSDREEHLTNRGNFATLLLG